MVCKRHLRLRISLPLFFFLAILVLPLLSVAQPDGAALFKSNCTACHNKPGEGKLIGPDIKGIDKKRSEEWLIKWIRSSSALIKSGDKDANAIFKEYGTPMTDFTNLKDDEIKAILSYIKTAGETVAVATAGAQNGGAATLAGEAAGEKTDGMLNSLIWVLLVVLIVAVYVLSRIRRSLENVVREREGLPKLQPLGVNGWLRKNKRFIALAIIFLLLVGMKQGWDTLKTIGVAQGYQPDQPIAFSHKVHAGDNGINCVYCHSGAEKSKTAGVPSANVCMNCHKAIKKGTNTGTAEIAKIYAALDYNPETQVYGSNPKPIKWTRVHNLSDLSYFNHSQHVNVAGLECQSCHGQMQENTVAKQEAPLTMQWCVDCHRTTEVKMDGNDYYTDLHAKLVKKYGDKTKITVDKIGGLECSKCHY